MSLEEFEPIIPASERPQYYALDRAAEKYSTALENICIVICVINSKFKASITIWPSVLFVLFHLFMSVVEMVLHQSQIRPE